MENIDIKALVNILEGQISLYRKLFQLGEDKRDILLARDIDGLEELTEEEELILPRVSKLEKQRQSIIGELTITQLIEKVEGEKRDKLIELRRDLVVLIDKFITLNDLNNKLIKDSLQLTTFTLNILNPKPGGTYGKKGYTNEDDRKNMIINHKA